MSYRIVITAQAEHDLRMIYEYIAFDRSSPETAQRLIERIKEKILSLDQFPFRFKRYLSDTWNPEGLRMMPVDRYIVFYHTDKGTGIVTVTNILHSGMDIDRSLFIN